MAKALTSPGTIYLLLPLLQGMNEPAIWVAPTGLGGVWGLKDVPLFDDILDLVKKNACVDESRVFVYGFSFGGMYSYSLSMTRQKSIRAAVGMSPANFNIQIPLKNHDPIARMQSTGMSDRTCPWVSDEASIRDPNSSPSNTDPQRMHHPQPDSDLDIRRHAL